MTQNTNLDALCAEYGFKIAKKTKNDVLITKALGVLQEQGVYAFFLFLQSRGSTEREAALSMVSDSGDLIAEIFDNLKSKDFQKDWSDILRKNILDNLDDLFLVLQLLEQTLIYARYHAKSIKEVQE
jgi:hypothetical protein